MASPTSPQQTTLPHRSPTATSDAIPDEDSSETTKLFRERLQAWKHAVAYLEEYVEATEKSEKSSSKEYSGKILKAVNSPLKEGEQFHQQNGGFAELFGNIRSNTQALAQSHEETAKALKGSVLTSFERLHSEIKNREKDLDKSAGKGSKAVDKARNDTQKHVELLGQHTAGTDSRGGSIKAADDPYLIQRQVYHRLHKQIIEENNNRDDMISVQNEFSRFEAHVVQSIQSAMQQFNQVMSHQADEERNMYGNMAATSSRIQPDFEWQGFVQRNNNLLIDPNGQKRSIENVNFPNQDHPSTRPLIAGSLERKGKLLKKYDAGYYVVTPAKYMHEFKSDNDFSKDPTPENSLYLPDCMIGHVDGDAFAVKGKDQSKGILSKMSTSHDYSFRAHTSEDARKWHDVILSVIGGASNSAPTSPVVGREESKLTPSTTTGQHTEGPIAPAPASTVGSAHQQSDLGGHTVAHTEKDYAGTVAAQDAGAERKDYAPL